MLLWHFSIFHPPPRFLARSSVFGTISQVPFLPAIGRGKNHDLYFYLRSKWPREDSGNVGSAMKYAIISDVHSNLEALERVLSEIKKANIDQVICLGDVVGYGANPSECLMLVREVAAQIIMGNHDQAIEDAALRNDFTPWAKEAIEWTASVLDEEDKRVLFKDEINKKNKTTNGAFHIFQTRPPTRSGF